MSEIVGAIKYVTDIMGEIRASSIEQSTGVVQVREAVKQIDQITRKNVALVAECVGAADRVKQQAHQLVQSVAVFKLETGAPALPTA